MVVKSARAKYEKMTVFNSKERHEMLVIAVYVLKNTYGILVFYYFIIFGTIIRLQLTSSPPCCRPLTKEF